MSTFRSYMAAAPRPDGRAADPARERDMRKLVIASLVSSVLEWFDFMIYATAAALVFGPLFFPALGGTEGTLASFGTLAVGFVARPFGGIIAGAVGDRYGRKVPLVGAMVIMGFVTFVIGVLPTHASIGNAAPVLLVIARLVQGIGVGAQWGGAAMLLVEHAPEAKRGFYSSFVNMGSIIGAALGSLMFLVLTASMSGAAFESWGWRIPFLTGLLLIAFGIYIQNKIEETPVFRELSAKTEAARSAHHVTKAPLRVALTQYWPQVLQALCAFFVVNGTFYIFVSGVLSYGTTVVGYSSRQILLVVLGAGLTQVVSIPFFGGLSDRVGTRKKVYLTGAAAMALAAFPIFWLVDSGNLFLAFLGLVLGFTIHASMFGPQTAMYGEMFPADVRLSGASLGFQLASVLAGGLAPLTMTALVDRFGGSWPVSIYIVAMAVVTFVGVWTVKEHYRRDLYLTTTEIEEAHGASRTAEARLTHLEDVQAIRQLRARYCHALDDQRWDDLIDTFTEEGIFVGLATAQGRENLKEFFSALSDGPIDAWWHFSANETVEIDGDRAAGMTWLWQPCVVEGRAQVAAGRYVDRMVRCTDGRWRFEERRVSFFWWVDQERGWTPHRFDFEPAQVAAD
ncbi:MFS transporter [Streptomyces shenzhenensis]|uniref:MFS transporter n=1 Tax=Streptomyces shenzhenensis TaxID=943815 RepID=UPI003D92DE38